MMSATSTSSGSISRPASRRGATRYLIRVGRQRGERVDLLGDAHGADLGGHRGADAAGDHQAGQHRAQLARHRQHDDVGDRALGVEAREAGIALQRQHHAGEERGQADDRQREVADVEHLPQDQPRIEGRPHAVRERGAGEERRGGRRRPGSRGRRGRSRRRKFMRWPAPHDRRADSAGRGGSGSRSRWCRRSRASVVDGLLRADELDQRAGRGRGSGTSVTSNVIRSIETRPTSGSRVACDDARRRDCSASAESRRHSRPRSSRCRPDPHAVRGTVSNGHGRLSTRGPAGFWPRAGRPGASDSACPASG